MSSGGEIHEEMKRIKIKRSKLKVGKFKTMMNALQLLNIGSSKLKIKGSYHIDWTRNIIIKCFKKEGKILINLKPKNKQDNIKKFDKLIQRRSLKEPIAYISKERVLSKQFL